LLSDKPLGPELDLALLSARLWQEIAAEPFGRDIEFESKGGLVVAADSQGLDALCKMAEQQRRTGVEARGIAADELGDLEPRLRPGLAGGVFYPQDAQVQPALAAAHLMAAARRAGARLRVGEIVTALLRAPDSAVRAVATSRGEIQTPAVVNAAGAWAGAVAALADVTLPVQPRRGFILVTEPLPQLIRHKVYAADYVADVASDSAALQTSAVVEGTASGPVLIGASRERVGFDRSTSLPVLSRLAAQAIDLFPVLARVNAIRAYVGFRPYLPDHLPAIGQDPRVPGLFHACGHEGAGIGLAPATGYLIARELLGLPDEIDMSAFRPDRFPIRVQEEAC